MKTGDVGGTRSPRSGGRPILRPKRVNTPAGLALKPILARSVPAPEKPIRLAPRFLRGETVQKLIRLCFFNTPTGNGQF